MAKASSSRSRLRRPFVFNGESIARGARGSVHLKLGQLYTDEPVLMPVHIVHGRKPGPTLFVSAAIHGDELNGIEIVRRLLTWKPLQRIRGTLIAVPMVNVLGVVHKTRNLPDRRDLNRSFPGSGHGSLAARMADRFMTEVVERCNYGIDLHTAAVHRSNLPQIRTTLEDREMHRLALAFGAPLVMDAGLRPGSLRETAAQCGVKTLLYEAGEALRFDETSIRIGVRGIIRVMRALDMLAKSRSKPPREPLIALSSRWVRASESGIVRSLVRLGQIVEKDQALGIVANTLGDREFALASPCHGVVIGKATLPLMHEGEAVFHIASFDKSDLPAESDKIIGDATLHDYDMPYDGPPP